jgi:uncharacterized protein (TIGR00661 family)|tara:strand:+ start:505 stop:1545 length:1041 start_codon:yes stop_codon:yes gene_type:complete
MTRILYGVAGEGMGHAVRSKVIIEELKKKNKIKMVASAKAYSYLSGLFDAEEIDYFKIIYRNNKAANFLTFLNNIIRLPRIIAKSWKISGIIRDFKPDVIITDFEPFVAYFAFFKRIPVISVDNQHILTNSCPMNLPQKYWLNSLIMKLVVKLFIIKSNRYFINSYYNCRIKGRNSIIIKPLLRKEILNAKTTNRNHILVYQTSKSNRKLIEELQKIKQKFIVYGFDRNKSLGNVILKGANEKEFLKDLSSCKAVITNGGFTLISEALYLKKPILSIPVKSQFEQTISAIYLERLGYGMFAEETSKGTIKKFINDISKFKNKLKNYKKYNNDEAIRKINDAVEVLS